MRVIQEDYGSSSAQAAEQRRLQAIADAKAVADAKARILAQKYAYDRAQAASKASSDARTLQFAKAKSKAQAAADAQALAQSQAVQQATQTQQASQTQQAAQALQVQQAAQQVSIPRPSAPAVSSPSAASEIDPSLTALNASREAQVKSQDIAWADALRLANEQKDSATKQAEQFAQEAFVSRKQQERVLPNIMAQSGLSGQGYTETTANNIGTSYQNALNSVLKNKSEAFSKVDSSLMGEQSKINQNKAGIDASYQTNVANYRANLEKDKANQAIALAKARSSYASANKPILTPEQKIDESIAKKDFYKAQVKERIKEMGFVSSGQRGNPIDPQGTRISMLAQLQDYIRYKYLTESELEDVINAYLETYYSRTSATGLSMNQGQRLGTS